VIELITRLLIENNISKSNQRLRYDIVLTKGSCLLFNVYCGRKEFYFFKVTEIDDLHAEYKNYCKAQDLFGDYMPKLIGFYRIDGWDIFVSKGIHHRVLAPGRIVANDNHFANEIVGFLGAMTEKAMLSAPEKSHGELMRILYSHFKDTPYRTIIEQWLDNDSIKNLPYIPQHGDFVINNLAGSGSQLIIFDWEDYGKITLPGFDFCTLLMSDLQFDYERILDYLKINTSRQSTHLSFLLNKCALTGVSLPLFLRLIPLYLVIFLYLKKDYGSEIQARIGRLITRFQEHPEWI